MKEVCPSYCFVMMAAKAIDFILRHLQGDASAMRMTSAAWVQEQPKLLKIREGWKS